MENFFQYILILSFIINVIVAIILLTKKPRGKAVISFGIFVISLAFWCFTRIMSDVFYNEATVLFWSKLALVGPIIIPVIFLYFALIFVNQWDKIFWLKKIFLFLPTLILLVFIPTSYNIIAVRRGLYGTEIIPGILYLFFSIYFIIYLFLAFYILLKKYQKSDNLIEKHQILWVVWSVAIVAIIGIIGSAILPLFQINFLDNYSPSLAIIIVLSVSYAILRYRFLDIISLIKRVLAYLVVFIIIVIVGTLLLDFLEEGMTEILLSNNLLGNFILSLSLSIFIFIFSLISFTWIKNFLVQDDIYRINKNKIKEISYAQSELKKLLDKITELIQESIKVEFVEFYLLDFTVAKFKNINFFKQLTTLERENALLKFLENNKNIAIKDEIECRFSQDLNETNDDYQAVIKTMNQFKAAVVLPVFTSEKKELFALILLGKKHNKRMFTKREITYLEEIFDFVNYAITTTILYKQAIGRIEKMQEEGTLPG